MNNNNESHVGAWLLFGLSMLYLVSPVDLIPDFIPVLGQLDDLFAAVFSTLNLIQETLKSSMYYVSLIAKYLKWLSVAFVVSLPIIAVTSIIKLFT